MILSVCSAVNVTFLVLKQRNYRQQKEVRDIKVKSKVKGKSSKSQRGTTDLVNESEHERLLKGLLC